mmetsp:Transcript_73947/g.197089  ORF Transcript_73947/g.197089 Transcript_73947/m.197089 type:complete len:316 (+) Transcript_73947:1878-2825(+)
MRRGGEGVEEATRLLRRCRRMDGRCGRGEGVKRGGGRRDCCEGVEDGRGLSSVTAGPGCGCNRGRRRRREGVERGWLNRAGKRRGGCGRTCGGSRRVFPEGDERPPSAASSEAARGGGGLSLCNSKARSSGGRRLVSAGRERIGLALGACVVGIRCRVEEARGDVRGEGDDRLDLEAQRRLRGRGGVLVFVNVARGDVGRVPWQPREDGRKLGDEFVRHVGHGRTVVGRLEPALEEAHVSIVRLELLEMTLDVDAVVGELVASRLHGAQAVAHVTQHRETSVHSLVPAAPRELVVRDDEVLELEPRVREVLSSQC